MQARALLLIAAWAGAGLWACRDREGGPASGVGGASRKGEGPVVARADVVAGATASSQEAGLAAALVREALLAERLREQRSPLGTVLRRAALARAMSERIASDARRGPITEAELAAFAERHWLHVDRPASARTSHVVVLDASKDEAAARAFLLAVAAKAGKFADEAAFRAEAEALHAAHWPELQIRAEALPPVTADGRVVSFGDGPRPERLAPQYAAAANAIAAPGGLSPITTSPFGLHLIYLAERFPEHRLAPAALRRIAGEEIYSLRARREEQELLAERAQALSAAGTPVVEAEGALAATEWVRLR